MFEEREHSGDIRAKGQGPKDMAVGPEISERQTTRHEERMSSSLERTHRVAMLVNEVNLHVPKELPGGGACSPDRRQLPERSEELELSTVFRGESSPGRRPATQRGSLEAELAQPSKMRSISSRLKGARWVPGGIPPAHIELSSEVRRV